MATSYQIVKRVDLEKDDQLGQIVSVDKSVQPMPEDFLYRYQLWFKLSVFVSLLVSFSV